MRFQQAWQIVCAELGIEGHGDRKVALDALFGLGAFIQEANRKTALGSGEQGVVTMPKEYNWSIGHLRSICVRDNAGLATSGLYLRFADRSERPTRTTTVGGVSVVPDEAERAKAARGDEPLTVLAKRTRQRPERITAHLTRKLAEAIS
jgi:hypothetical protein